MSMNSMQIAAAAERNKTPILDVLLKHLTSAFDGRVFEIASGTGQHITHFAQSFPKATWQPSDIEQSSLDSISANILHYKLTNVEAPVLFDVTDPTSWPTLVCQPSSYDVIYNSNMVHIAPWRCAVALFDAAHVLLKPGGCLITYGPYANNGVLEPESNAQFDRFLKERNPDWGIRDIQHLKEQAHRVHITLTNIIEMPANNKTLIWQKDAFLF